MIPSNKSICIWGCADTTKPRVRILIQGLIASLGQKQVKFITYSLFKGVTDKSQLTKARWLRYLFTMPFVYLLLIIRYLYTWHYSVLLVTYMGHIDLPIAKLLSMIRSKPLIFDSFISLYDTVVNDRKMIRPESYTARLLFRWEQWIYSLPDLILFDTHEHKKRLSKLLDIAENRGVIVPVGAQTTLFYPDKSIPSLADTILFYGQCIPLHGMHIIVEAARISQQNRQSFRWILIGTGQQSAAIDRQITDCSLKNISRIKKVAYETLPYHIHRAGICLGIFGTSQKAFSVIPNKVYQICACNKPLITADTPAIRELLQPNRRIILVEPGNANALYRAVCEMSARLKAYDTDEPILPAIGPAEVGRKCAAIVENITL